MVVLFICFIISLLTLVFFFLNLMLYAFCFFLIFCSNFVPLQWKFTWLQVQFVNLLIFLSFFSFLLFLGIIGDTWIFFITYNCYITSFWCCLVYCHFIHYFFPCHGWSTDLIIGLMSPFSLNSLVKNHGFYVSLYDWF